MSHPFQGLTGSETRRGRIRMTLSYAPGSGKSFRLLEQARLLANRGERVVVGHVDTRGWSDEPSLPDCVVRLPSRRVTYSGVSIQEMDVDAVLALRPQVVVVDDAAHVNPPGFRHRLRHHDILELTAAGIDVLTACDLSHLDGPGERARHLAMTPMHVVLPDSFLESVWEIEALDLCTTSLLARWRSSRRVLPTWAESDEALSRLEHLREMTLRAVADWLARRAKRRIAMHPFPGPAGRVLVYADAPWPMADMLARKGARMANRLDTAWFLVYMRSSGSSDKAVDIDSAEITPTSVSLQGRPLRQEEMVHTLSLAEQLGAEVVGLDADDPVSALLDFARSHLVGHLLVGRRPQRRWWRRSTLERLIAEADGLNVHVLSWSSEDDMP
ncbi:Sensor protein KdpD [Candidatus Magnetaquicoccaceae bacterium FCR-1]|uniref:Sensor protein KdpD n=1 Tax=Candidatus Magnetaquiglobus chichijimensis TaxID=3141448 RepID=A0ABQ0CBQ8_9PROT